MAKEAHGRPVNRIGIFEPAALLLAVGLAMMAPAIVCGAAAAEPSAAAYERPRFAAHARPERKSGPVSPFRKHGLLARLPIESEESRTAELSLSLRSRPAPAAIAACGLLALVAAGFAEGSRSKLEARFSGARRLAHARAQGWAVMSESRPGGTRLDHGMGLPRHVHRELG